MTIAPPKKIAHRARNRRRGKKPLGRRLPAPNVGQASKQGEAKPLLDGLVSHPSPLASRKPVKGNGSVPRTVQAFHGQVNEWITEAFTLMGAPELAGEIPWHWNNRLTRAMGRAHRRRVGQVYNPTKMDFSPRLFKRATPEERKQVVFHECAHIVDYHKGTFNPRKPHGPTWKRYMRLAGRAPERCHSVMPVGRVEVYCRCQTHLVTKKKRAKIRSGVSYHCKDCGSRVTAVKIHD